MQEMRLYQEVSCLYIVYHKGCVAFGYEKEKTTMGKEKRRKRSTGTIAPNRKRRHSSSLGKEEKNANKAQRWSGSGGPSLTNNSGRADAPSETPFQTARREAWEEIGLPGIDQPLPHPFTVEHLCELPANLAKTEVVVRPCVALLHSYDAKTGQNADPEISLIPKLDAREVAAVFTAPFYSFLRLREGEELASNSDLEQNEGADSTVGSARADQGSLGADAKGYDNDLGDWYRGSWSLWHNSNWRSTYSFPFFRLPARLRYNLGYDYRAPFFNALVFNFPLSHMARGPVKSDPLSMVQGLSLEGETGRTEPCFQVDLVTRTSFVFLIYSCYCSILLFVPNKNTRKQLKDWTTDQAFDTSAPVLCSRQYPGGHAKAPQGGEC